MRSCAITLLLLSAASAHAQEATRTAGMPDVHDKLRWELITEGQSSVANGNDAGAPENLSGTKGNFLFQLDFQPLLDYTGDNPARRSRHAKAVVGVVGTPRAITARADLANSDAVNNLRTTGVTVTPPTTPAAGSPTLTQQRSFTFGFEYSDNYLLGAEGSGVFSELGGLLRLNFDAFIDDERFFEKDGLTYVRVPTGLGADDGGDYRLELGGRFRVSNGEMKFVNDRGGNVDDLLLFEMVYRYSGATDGLRSDTNTANRFTWRAIAMPRIHKPKDTEANTIKAVIGIEVDRDLKMKGPMDVRLFYGTNINIEALFK